MEVVDACSTLLSNKEVLDLLKSNASKKQTNLATIIYETTSYLESSPAATSSTSDLVEFLDAIKERKYDLSKMEKIQIANLKPENETELHLIIDNIEERFTEEQRADLLQIIHSILINSQGIDCQAYRKKHKQ